MGFKYPYPSVALNFLKNALATVNPSEGSDVISVEREHFME